MSLSEHRWNARGEGYVAAQVLVLAGIVALPLLRPRRETPRGLRVAGTALVLAGGTLTGWSGLRLGPNLTPLPEPRVDGQLVQTGPYALVRHPIYGGQLWQVVVSRKQRHPRKAGHAVPLPASS